MEVADLWVRLRALTGDFTASMGAATGEASGMLGALGGLTGKIGAASGLALGAIGVAAVKMASDFQDSMTRIQNLAQVPKSSMAQLQSGVLSLAGQVGFSPDSLAQALYHVESSFASTGITGSEALKILKTAAEGAKIGNANLVDVTNALDAAVVSGIPGVQDYGAAMSALLTTVGSGDMTMQNLADAFSTGILANAKVYGLTIKDVGAALATFGDNNIRGTVAATDLRMAIMNLTKQGKPGEAALKGIGIQVGQLATDLQRGGLNAALTDLHQHLVAAGDGGAKMGLVLEDAFTKKSSAPMAVLLSQFDRLQSKYKELNTGPSFTQQWATHLNTFKQQWSNFISGLESGLIRVGNVLLPIVTKALGYLNDAFQWLGKHPDVLTAIFAGLAAVAAPVVIAAVVGSLGMLLDILTGPIGLLFALGAGFTYAYEHSKTFRTIVGDVAGFLRNVLGGAIGWVTHSLIPALGRAFDWVKNGPLRALQNAVGYFAGWIRSNWSEIRQATSEAWTVISKIVTVAWNVIWTTIQPGVTALQIIWDVAWGGFKDTLRLVWDLIKNIVVANVHLIMNTIQVFLDLVTGHWGKAWHDMGHLLSQAISDLWNIISGFTRDALNLLYDAGRNLIQGLINGVKSMVSSAVNAVKSVGSSVVGAFKSVAGIFSPSTVFHEFGVFIGQGLVNGITSMHGAAGAAARALAGQVSAGFNASPIVGPRMVGPNGAMLGAAGGGAFMGGGSGFAAAGTPQQQIVLEIDGRQFAQVMFPHMQRQSLTTERRNGNNGLSARRTSKV